MIEHLERATAGLGQDEDWIRGLASELAGLLEDTWFLVGKGFVDRVTGERMENIERAIAAYHQARALANHRKAPNKRLGEIEHNLATVYRLRLDGVPAENLEQALTPGQQSLCRLGLCE